MNNINFSLFFKFNLAVTTILFLFFLQYNENYDFISFTLATMGAISSATILYMLFFILLFIFTFSKKFVLYLSGTIFFITNIALIVDFLIFRLYKFHINAMVLNIMLSPDAMDSIQLGVVPLLVFGLVIIIFLILELYIIKRLIDTQKDRKISLNKRLNRLITIPLILIVFSEKISYGVASLFTKDEIISKFKVIPLYQPLTFNRIAKKYFNYMPKTQAKNTISKNSALDYPLDKIVIKENPNKINIFIIASDALRNSVTDKETMPNLYKLKQDSLVFHNHHSGGNATRFGIFSLFYGINSTYWFSFLNATRGPVFFDILKQLNYQIDIISSTNTNWPEFKKTCYVNIQDSIKDGFEGKPWQKDAQSANYFMKQVENYNIDKPIFSFVFFDAPHGYSFPKESNKFNADDENINYLTVTKNGKDIKSIFSRYKNSAYYNDKLLGDMIASLKKRDLYENSLIIFTSDHGQEFYEYGSFGHNSSFSKAQTNSPLVIKLPKKFQDNIELPDKFSTMLTSHNDIVPTILNLIGVTSKSSDYSNGYNIFSKDFKRESIFCANWNNNAIISNKHSYIFSNLPNKMFKNEIRDTKTYQKLDNATIDNKKVLKIMNDNRKFLK